MLFETRCPLTSLCVSRFSPVPLPPFNSFLSFFTTFSLVTSPSLRWLPNFCCFFWVSPQMSGGPVDMDTITQLLPGPRGPPGARQGSEDSSTPGGGPQLQPPAPQLRSPTSQSLPQLQSPPPQLAPPSPQLKLQSPTQLQPAEGSTPRSVNVKREPPGTPNRGSVSVWQRGGGSLEAEGVLPNSSGFQRGVFLCVVGPNDVLLSSGCSVQSQSAFDFCSPPTPSQTQEQGDPFHTPKHTSPFPEMDIVNPFSSSTGT